MKRPSGFTFVEILVTLSILAMLFVPMMRLFTSGMEAANASRDLITAVSLAKWEMERTKNLGASVERLTEEGAVVVFPAPEELPLALNGRSWRIHRLLKTASDPLEVAVEVTREGETEPRVRLVTLLADTTWNKQL